MLLSIIVPIYNVEKYLPKCIDSLINQDLLVGDYEIILVDDGSTDDSGKIADRYTEKYNFIHTIHQINAGLSAARNSGIRVAKGDYIQFVDSDDFLQPNVLCQLMDTVIKKELDVLRFKYQNVNEDNLVFSPYKLTSHADYGSEVTDGLDFLNNKLSFNCYAWQFVIKSSIVSEELFTPGIYFEDTDWTPRILLKAKKVSSINLVVYNYLMREGSITQSVQDSKKRKIINDKLLIIDNLLLYSKDVENDLWYKGMIAHLSVTILDYIALNYYKERKSFIKALSKKPIFPLTTFNANKKVTKKIFLINISPALFCLLMYIKNK